MTAGHLSEPPPGDKRGKLGRRGGGDTCEVVQGGGRLDARYELNYGDCSFYHNVNMLIFLPF